MSSSESHNVDALIKLIQEKAELKSGVGPDRALQARKLFRKAMDMPLTKDMFRENLVKVFSISLDETTLDALFRRYDADNDGNIDMGEFAKQILLEDFPKNGRGLRFEEEDIEGKFAPQGSKKQQPIQRVQVFKGTVEQAKQFLINKILSLGLKRGFKLFLNQTSFSREITFEVFRKTLKNCFYVSFEDGLLEQVFQSWDSDKDGILRFFEFQRHVTPKDYTGRNWLDDSEERGMQTLRQRKEAAKNLDMHALPVSLAKWGWSLNKIEQNIRNKLLLLCKDDNDRTRSVFGLFNALGKNRPFVSIKEFLDIMRGRLQIVLTHTEANLLAKRYSSTQSGVDSNGEVMIDLHVFTKKVFPLQYSDELFYLKFEERGLKEMAAKRDAERNQLKAIPTGGDYKFSAKELLLILQGKVFEQSESENQQFLFLRNLLRVPPDDEHDNFVTLARFSEALSRFGFSIDPKDQQYVFETAFDPNKKGAVNLHAFHKLLMNPKKLPPRDRFLAHLKTGALNAIIPESFQFPHKKRPDLPQTIDEVIEAPTAVKAVGNQNNNKHLSVLPSEKNYFVPSPPTSQMAVKKSYNRGSVLCEDSTEGARVQKKVDSENSHLVRHHSQPVECVKAATKSDSVTSPRSPRSPRKVPNHLYHSPVAKARLEKHIRALSMSPRPRGF